MKSRMMRNVAWDFLRALGGTQEHICWRGIVLSLSESYQRRTTQKSQMVL